MNTVERRRARTSAPMADLLVQRAEQHPDATWLRFGDDAYSWGQALSLARRAANGLLAAGARPGDRVAIMMSNRPEFVWLHLGAVLMGALSVPVNTAQRGAALEHILADSDAAILAFDADLHDGVQEVLDRLPHLRGTVTTAGAGAAQTVEQLLDAPDTPPPVPPAGGGVGILYTSGTTGPPKGVVATRYDTAPLHELLRATGVRPGETMYTPLPLFHGNALLVSLLGSMVLDARLAVAPRFSASRFWDDCRRVDAVQFNALGAMISIMLKQPPRPGDRDHAVRVVLSAGCTAELWEPFQQRFGVRLVEWFGMVDAPGVLMNTTGRVGSIGKPVGGVEFRVVDDQDRPLPPGQVGELVFRHPEGQLTHYHKRPDVTAEAYRGGWFHSGDLAVVDADGYFSYRGRKKQSMRRRGENISAWEIETVLERHPDVLECAAHAVPSELGEDEVKVVVVARPGATIAPAALVRWCAGRMADYAVPRFVEVLDELPRTATQRVRYAELRARGVTPTTHDRHATAGHDR